VSRDQFGDFQTPPALAREVCRILAARGIAPRAVLEPTCGTGAFLAAAGATFPGLAVVLGVDRNAAHLRAARRRVPGATLREADVFAADWTAWIGALPDPLLVLGNPPWVTNAAIGALGGGNLPAKSNVRGAVGLDARTGKSNFDVSEWIVTRLCDELRGRRGAVVAMLCKTAVGRKVLAHAWRTELPLRRADLYPIDAAAHFGAAVDASLLVCAFDEGPPMHDCTVHARLADAPVGVCGWRDGGLVADVAAHARVRYLRRRRRRPRALAFGHQARLRPGHGAGRRRRSSSQRAR
jgi:SAM-dependent methyltransferase